MALDTPLAEMQNLKWTRSLIKVCCFICNPPRNGIHRRGGGGGGIVFLFLSKLHQLLLREKKDLNSEVIELNVTSKKVLFLGAGPLRGGGGAKRVCH